MTQKNENLIIKYLNKSATKTDLDLISKWIENPVNLKVFKSYIQTHYAIIYGVNNPETKKVVEQLLKSIRKEKSFVHRLKNQLVFRYAAAAIVVGVLASSYFFIDKTLTPPVNNTPIIVNYEILTGTDKATLTLEDGTSIMLEKGKQYVSDNVESNGEDVIYKSQDRPTAEIAYHYLTIPRGGEYHLKLSDGTEVWLNSESQLKYPVAFVEGETRQVELVYGEAYFDVSSSTQQKGARFLVLNQGQEIEVLGTEFNIKAYKDETHIYTTLVEGKVAVRFNDKKQNLIPNQQSKVNLSDNAISIATVDVYNAISWKEGVFSFEEKSLKDIMKVLSRWYDMDVIFITETIEDVEFVGVLSKDQKIEEILTSIKNFGIIKNYKINGKTVVLE